MPELQEPLILWCGRFSKWEGYATVSKNHLKGLLSIGAPVAAYDVDHQQLVGPPPPTQLTVTAVPNGVEIKPVDKRVSLAVVYHERPDRYPLLKVKGKARFIGHSVFETEKLPPDWPALMVAVDELWVASDFNMNTFTSSGIPRFMLHKVPHSLDCDLYPEPGRDKGRNTTYLTVLSTFARRDLSLLFRSFLVAFDTADDVRLIVKVRDSYTDVRTAETLLRDAVGASPSDAAGVLDRIEIRAGDYTNEQMTQLYQECQVYVSVERANGWDLPLMEAMASGKATIGVDWGGASEYATPEVGLRLPVGPGYEYISSLGAQSPMYTAQLWPTVKEHDLIDSMRWCYENPRERAELGYRARQHIRDNYSTSVIAGAIMKRISSLSAEDYRLHTPARVIHSRKDSLWQPVVIPTRIELATNAVTETIQLAGQVPRWQISNVLRAYKSASTVRSLMYVSKAERDRLISIRSLDQAMIVPRSRPMKKAIRMLKFLSVARREFDSAVPDHDLLEGIAEFWQAEDGGTTTIDDAYINRRRRVWGEYGGIPLTAHDTERLDDLRDSHHGERIFLMGNGPSLNKLDLSMLKDEWTFGVNKIYMMFDRIDWRPSFWTAMDWRVGPDMGDDYRQLDGITKFVPYRFKGILPSDETTYWYHSRPVGDYIQDQFELDITRGVPSRGTVLITAIQLAFFLGFRELILIGVDARYKIPDTVKQSGGDRFGTGVMLNLESTDDDDPNHFDPRYFGKGAKWHDPNVTGMMRMFHTMRRGIEYNGGRIVNATPGGNLDVFDRVDYNELF